MTDADVRHSTKSWLDHKDLMRTLSRTADARFLSLDLVGHILDAQVLAPDLEAVFSDIDISCVECGECQMVASRLVSNNLRHQLDRSLWS